MLILQVKTAGCVDMRPQGNKVHHMPGMYASAWGYQLINQLFTYRTLAQ